MRFRFCMGCYQFVAHFEDGKILCKSKGCIKPPCFCGNLENRCDCRIIELSTTCSGNDEKSRTDTIAASSNSMDIKQSMTKLQRDAAGEWAH